MTKPSEEIKKLCTLLSAKNGIFNAPSNPQDPWVMAILQYLDSQSENKPILLSKKNRFNRRPK